MSWCVDCPRQTFTDDDLAKIRVLVPDFEARKVCCMVRDELEEQVRSADLQHSLKMREIERKQVHRGAPRNRAERRLAAREARRA